MKTPLFRQTALERLASPEQLDRLMQVTRPVGWLSLLALGLIVLAVLLWGIFGSIPVQVSGQGILLSSAGIHDVVSPQAGLVVDVPVKAGDVIQVGQVVATISSESTSSTQITSPYTGRVLELKVDSGSTVDRGTALLSVEGLNAQGRVDLVAVVYVAPAEGKKIHPGMEVQVSPSTVRREEYGFMLGRVTSVGQFPATAQGMLRVLGNTELVKRLSAGGTPIEVQVDLTRDTQSVSGYAWSSKVGPPTGVDSGTLCDSWVTLHEVQPISLVLPILK
jgi:multidrug efflux pump subunit AcrA (membrane-fusion protein)